MIFRAKYSLGLLILLCSNFLYIENSNAALYAFTSHTFTNCSATGANGPTQAACRSSYSTTWDETDANYTVTGGIQKWTVPETGSYEITAVGAAGANGSVGTGGMGASITGTFSLTQGEFLYLIVGQKGTFVAYVAGGGGGTFVYKNASDTYPLIAAGGGGGGAGGGGTGFENGIDAVTTNNGTNGNNVSQGAGTSGGGGTSPGTSFYALGGAGWLSNGNVSNQSCTNNGVAALAPRNGATGGNSNQAGTYGGFGGGGAPAMRCGAIAGGGGGGYSGGGAGGENPSGSFNGGGGGGSYNGGSSPTINGVTNTGSGSITIRLLAVVTPNFNSLALTGNVTSATFRSAITINASVNVSSKVTFKAGNIIIVGCKNKVATGSGSTYTTSCTWKPSTRGSVRISASAVPVSGGGTGYSSPLSISVVNRSGAR